MFLPVTETRKLLISEDILSDMALGVILRELQVTFFKVLLFNYCHRNISDSFPLLSDYKTTIQINCSYQQKIRQKLEMHQSYLY